MRFLLRFTRIIRLVATCTSSLFSYLVKGRGHSDLLKAEWAHELAVKIVRILRIDLITRGNYPTAGMITCNHMSYLDILVILAHAPAIFVAKREVRDWPLVGGLAKLAGTRFIDRSKKSQVKQLNEEIEALLVQGVRVVVFPEGTTTDGSEVKPFHPSLLSNVAKRKKNPAQWPVCPAGLRYFCDDAVVAEKICFWKEMDFAPHFFNLLGIPYITARIRFGQSSIVECNRKQLAKRLHAAVGALAGTPMRLRQFGKENHLQYRAIA